MSYESKMLEQLAMPTRKEVEQVLLRALLKHNGVIKELGSGEEIVEEIAGDFGLSERQYSASKNIPLASASFPGCRLVSQTEHGFATDPNAPTYQRREWMLMKQKI
jgi:hypothetical protein